VRRPATIKLLFLRSANDPWIVFIGISTSWHLVCQALPLYPCFKIGLGIMPNAQAGLVSVDILGPEFLGAILVLGYTMMSDRFGECGRSGRLALAVFSGRVYGPILILIGGRSACAPISWLCCPLDSIGKQLTLTFCIGLVWFVRLPLPHLCLPGAQLRHPLRQVARAVEHGIFLAATPITRPLPALSQATREDSAWIT